MPLFWAIEFRVEPCTEHMHIEGFALRIEGSDSSEQNASVWVATGGWMEQPETLELRKLPRSEITWERAHELIEELRSTTLRAAPAGVMGIHATTHKLVVEYGFNSVSYKWWHELPSEWVNLSAVIGKLKEVAYEASHRSAA
jgi:hypothetical protein